jgi:hypothetical protein
MADQVRWTEGTNLREIINLLKMSSRSVAISEVVRHKLRTITREIESGDSSNLDKIRRDIETYLNLPLPIRVRMRLWYIHDKLENVPALGDNQPKDITLSQEKVDRLRSLLAKVYTFSGLTKQEHADILDLMRMVDRAVRPRLKPNAPLERAAIFVSAIHSSLGISKSSREHLDWIAVELNKPRSEIEVTRLETAFRKVLADSALPSITRFRVTDLITDIFDT